MSAKRLKRNGLDIALECQRRYPRQYQSYVKPQHDTRFASHSEFQAKGAIEHSRDANPAVVLLSDGLYGGADGWAFAGLAYFGVRHRMLPMVLFSIVPLGEWSFVTVREYLRGAKTLDADSVTRRDRKRFLWAELQDIKFLHWRLQSGQQGGLNHVQLRFPRGQVRIFPLILENGWEAVQWVERLAAQRKSPAPTAAPPAPKPAPKKDHKQCSICSQLSDYQFGRQTYGREEEDTFFPDAAAALKTMHEVEPGKNRSPLLPQCSECGTYYLHEIEYEYLATGSKDGQRLTRLTVEEATKYLG